MGFSIEKVNLTGYKFIYQCEIKSQKETNGI